MAISKSAKKALRQNSKHKAQNTKNKIKLRKLLKETKTLISQKKADEAKKIIPQVYKALDKAVKTGLIKKNNASRKKARLSLAINKIGK